MEACFDVSQLYARGDGVPQDLEMESKFLGISCELGDERACAKRKADEEAKAKVKPATKPK
jgi:TPR repeat protein